ncbi:hypothetical protein T02_5835 [Trichinella nativa]|uniref:Uncharacterized protein n=1 Tax=Trichinella nativa TaxID=6335 RepID=A0A0V1LQR9_9BILA|nr:hypothetical protein T02_5835 [Trichinella nativa]
MNIEKNIIVKFSITVPLSSSGFSLASSMISPTLSATLFSVSTTGRGNAIYNPYCFSSHSVLDMKGSNTSNLPYG